MSSRPVSAGNAEPVAPEPQSNGDADGASGTSPFVPSSTVMPERRCLRCWSGRVAGHRSSAHRRCISCSKSASRFRRQSPSPCSRLRSSELISRKFLPIRRATILENNIVQTTGSAGESIAFGVGVTMPALFLLGFRDGHLAVSRPSPCLGGLLGILMMIPLRRAFVVKQHGRLKYPEGTACADVLIVGEQGSTRPGRSSRVSDIAFIYSSSSMKAMKFWKDTLALSPALLPSTGQGLKGVRLGGELDSGFARRRLYHPGHGSPPSWWPAACLRTS